MYVCVYRLDRGGVGGGGNNHNYIDLIKPNNIL